MSNCKTIDKDLDKLLENLPFFIQETLINHPNKDQLIEIVMDLGRRSEARFLTGPQYLSQKIVGRALICSEIREKRIDRW